MFVDAKSPSLQEKCDLKPDILPNYNKCTLIIIFKINSGQIAQGFNVKNERPGFGLIQNDMASHNNILFFGGEFYNHSSLNEETGMYVTDPYMLKFDTLQSPHVQYDS